MKKGVPISPADVPLIMKEITPGFVFDAFNECIAKYLTGGSATFQQSIVSDIIKIAAKEANLPFQYEWLNIEDVYRAHGWNVEYDKPAYCETYPATFTFRKKN